MLKLLIQDDEGRKTLVPFSREEITIGREDGNTIRLTERNVSRKHARLFKYGMQIFVEDLNSHNGIQLNGQRIAGQAIVRKGDTIGIGDYDIFLEGNLSAPPPPPPKNPEFSDRTPPLPSLIQQNHPPAEEPLPELLSEKTAPGNHIPASDFASTPPPAPMDFAASVASNDRFDSVEERADFAASIASRDTLDLAEERTDFAASIASRDTLDLAEESPPGERPTVRLPEFMELTDSEAPRLVALNLDLRGREFLCCRSEFSLGHSNINDLVLKHSSVAPIHCRIERDEQGHWFLALDPRYPVLVNDKLYQQQFALEDGDVLTLGKQKLQFFLPSSTLPPLPPQRKKNTPSRSKFRPFGIGLLLSLIVVLGFLCLYWSIGALHESPSQTISSLAYQFLPLPPSLKTPPNQRLSADPKKPQQDASPQNTDGDAPPPEEPPTKNPEIPATSSAQPPETTPNPETIRLGAALHTPQKPPESNTTSTSKFDKALEKTTTEKTAAGRHGSKMASTPPVRHNTKMTRETQPPPSAAHSTVASVANTLAPSATVEPDTPSSPFNDEDLFWEDVYLLKKKAERGVTPDRRATLSSLHDKLSGCETARCAYELAKTSFMLSMLGSAPAKTRFLEEFEAYLKMPDAGRQSHTRREEACKTLLDHYNSAENAAAAKAKVQALSKICTQ